MIPRVRSVLREPSTTELLSIADLGLYRIAQSWQAAASLGDAHAAIGTFNARFELSCL